jgi:hypothetical protein
MKEKINKFNHGFLISKFIKFLIIPLLLSLWFGLTVLYIIHLDTAFSLLSYNLPQSVFTHLSQGKLEKGSFVSGEFLAQDNNLGILSLRFETFFRPAYQNEDLLLFQIKQKGAREWYYKSTYRDGTIYDVPFFPFGFPIIPNSKGKVYEFKITSLGGDVNNSVAISTRWQSIAAKYKFTKGELLRSKVSLLQFSIKKFINSFQTIDVLFSSFVYLLPLLFYLILLSPLKKYVEKPLILIEQKIFDLGKSKFLKFLLPSSDPSERVLIIFFDTILLGVALIDGVYLQLGNDFVYLFVPVLWIAVQKHFRFSGRKTFIVGIIILLFQPFLLLFNLGQIAVNLAVWAYLFLVAGTIQAIIEIREKDVRLKT